MELSTVTIQRTGAGFDLINWTDNASQALGSFLISDAPHSLERLETFLDSEQEELVLPNFILQKHATDIVVTHADEPELMALLSRDRFVGLIQEWLFFLQNESPEITLYLTTPEFVADIDPTIVHIAVGQYGGQNVISTRFPRSWDHETIIQKVHEALERVIEGSDDKVIGITNDGIVLQMYVKNGQIAAVFPSKLYNVKS